VDQSPTYIFDAYGTLLDLSAAARRVLADRPAEYRLLAEVWRGRQLEYAWTDMALGHSTDFWSATTRALDTALVIVGLSGDAALRDSLLAAYADLDAYDDAVPAIERIVKLGGRCVTYSNANDAMLRRSLSAAHLDRVLQDAVSVDGVGVYKPDQRAYAYIREVLGLGDDGAFFVSSNPWDAAGASRAGFRAIWVNRQEAPYPFPAARLHGEIADLNALAV
jgi:2-haloacid dehalogenase